MEIEQSYFCDYCDNSENIKIVNHILFTCPGCKIVKYCSVECQANAKSEHREFCNQRTQDLHQVENVFTRFPSVQDSLKGLQKEEIVPLEPEEREILWNLEYETYEIADKKEDYFCYEQAMNFCWILKFDSELILNKIKMEPRPITFYQRQEEMSRIKECKHEIALLGGKLALYDLILNPDQERIYLSKGDDFVREETEIESNLIFTETWSRFRISRRYWTLINMIYDIKKLTSQSTNALKNFIAFKNTIAFAPRESVLYRLYKTDVVTDIIREKLIEQAQYEYETVKYDLLNDKIIHSAGGSGKPKIFRKITLHDYLYGYDAFYNCNPFSILTTPMTGRFRDKNDDCVCGETNMLRDISARFSNYLEKNPEVLTLISNVSIYQPLDHFKKESISREIKAS